MIRRLAFALAIALCLAAAGPATASAAFGLSEVDVTFTEQDGSPSMQAGTHPFKMRTDLAFETVLDPTLGFEVPEGSTRNLKVHFPPGFTGNPTAVPYCPTSVFLAEGCPVASAIGFVDVVAGELGEITRNGVYSLPPPPGVAAKIGFKALTVPVTVELGVNPDPPYNLVASLANIPEVIPFYGSELTTWGTPADPRHDSERINCGTSCSLDIPEKPFLLLPRSCAGPLETVFEVSSWEAPDSPVFKSAFTHDNSVPPNPLGITACDRLGFGPRIAALPTSRSAESPSGLDFDLTIEDEGIGSPGGRARSDVKKAEVTLPEGVTLNPSQAEGLGVCTEADLQRERADSGPGEGCPQSSKVGVVEAQTPLLEGRTLTGSLYVAEPFNNRFGTLIALYMTVREPELGILVKLAGKVEPDPRTGQLVTTFDDLPQQPFSHFHLHFREGGRSPLVTPPTCGQFETEAVFTPWADPSTTYTTTSTFQIRSGPNGGPCPAAGTPPFEPGFQAGSINNDAGSFSPFYMQLTRRDGDQDLTRFSAELPPGLLAKLAGTGRCPDANIAAAGGGSGRSELADPSCPSSSEIGRVLAGAGVGPDLTYVPGKIYLAGPYNGAPLSVVGIVPAVAGPFDVGTVVTRLALRVDPRTAEVRVDGASSDPIPHILAGIPLKVRDIRAFVDRPDFTLNPTSCNPFAVGAQLWGGGGDVFNSADDAAVARSARFQAADCGTLGFKPRLGLKLKGGTKRGSNPALRAVYTPRRGDANLAGVVVRLPRSAFLDQDHIRTICTRVQFAANNCPTAAIYGRARAFTPLLDEPLEGPVYLRSSSNDLPDMVVTLRGIVDVEAVARIDSVKGGIRASFEDTPDAPLSRVIIDMQGGRKGLIVNSTNLCAGKHRARAQLSAHNAKRLQINPVVRPSCGGNQGRANRFRDR